MSGFLQDLSENVSKKVGGWHRKMAQHIDTYGTVKKVGKGSAHVGFIDVDLSGRKIHPLRTAASSREEAIDSLTMQLLQHHAAASPPGSQYMIPVESSNIRSIGYDDVTRRLYVQFKNMSIYQYDDVPPHVAMGLMNAPSHGAYFSQMIRDEYESTQIQASKVR